MFKIRHDFEIVFKVIKKTKFTEPPTFKWSNAEEKVSVVMIPQRKGTYLTSLSPLLGTGQKSRCTNVVVLAADSFF